MEARRLVIPDMFTGSWDAALVSTYGADLHFFERDLLRQMGRIGNRVVLADCAQINRSLSRGSQSRQLRQVNRTYLLAPVRIAQAAHVKFIMMLSLDRGLLAIGSGNLSMNGYASRGEVFTTYHYSVEDEKYLAAFLTVKDYLDELGANGSIDAVARDHILHTWTVAPWIFKSSDSTQSPIRHNLKATLLDQFLARVDGREIDELVVHAPFYDRECSALEQLLSATKPRKLQLLVQERLTSVDVSKLEGVLTRSGAEVELRSISAAESGVLIHAKFIVARGLDWAVCLQGSPNMSTVALLLHQPQSNLEMANLLEGDHDAFDYLISDLIFSVDRVDLKSMDLHLIESENDENALSGEDIVRELSWTAPILSGRFTTIISQPPVVIVGEDVATDVEWRLAEPVEGGMSFEIAVGERTADAIGRNSAIKFGLADGLFTITIFPYHRRALAGLASGQSSLDLLVHAADFDIEDEELERLLHQLDEVLVIDNRSIWRIVEGKSGSFPDEDENEIDGPHYDYADIDWTAILTHPKLVQYRNWVAGESANPTALAIILNSIAQKFREDVERKRDGGVSIATTGLADWWNSETSTDAIEDEQEAETAVTVRTQRSAVARSRAQRKYLRFIRRFVRGISDPIFLSRVGPSVVVPGYIVFNNICWRLIEQELADPLAVIELQEDLWDFFWGSGENGGYLEVLSVDEQIAVLDLLDRHHAEAVLICSFIEGYEILRRANDLKGLCRLRERLRRVLTNPLWQPSRVSLEDAATMAWVEERTSAALVDELRALANFTTNDDRFRAIEEAVGAKSGSVFTELVTVRRGSRNVAIPQFVIYDPDAVLSQESAARILEMLSSLDATTQLEYVRIKHETTKAAVIADFEAKTFFYALASSEDPVELDEPLRRPLSWEKGLEDLRILAS